MGYCIKLISEKEIREDDVKSIIFKLPDYLNDITTNISQTLNYSEITKKG